MSDQPKPINQLIQQFEAKGRPRPPARSPPQRVASTRVEKPLPLPPVAIRKPLPSLPPTTGSISPSSTSRSSLGPSDVQTGPDQVDGKPRSMPTSPSSNSHSPTTPQAASRALLPAQTPSPTESTPIRPPVPLSQRQSMRMIMPLRGIHSVALHTGGAVLVLHCLVSSVMLLRVVC